MYYINPLSLYIYIYIYNHSIWTAPNGLAFVLRTTTSKGTAMGPLCVGSVVDGAKLTGHGQLSLILSPGYEECYEATPPGKCYKQIQGGVISPLIVIH